MQGGQPRALALACLEANQVVACARGERTHLVQLRIVPWRYHAAIANRHGRVLDQRLPETCCKRREFAHALEQRTQQRGLQHSTGLLQRRQRAQGLTQSGEVARTRGVQGDAREDAFHVTDRGEPLPRLHEGRVGPKRGDRILPRDQHLDPARRAPQPAPQPARTHRGAGGVEHPSERVLAAAGEVDVYLEVAQRCGIQHHRIFACVGGDRVDVREFRALGVTGIAEQAACRAYREPQSRATEARQITGAELSREQRLRALGIELPWRASTQSSVFGDARARSARLTGQ